ncbi:peptidase MA family metallohydrolase [Chloroflexota bacterium]
MAKKSVIFTIVISLLIVLSSPVLVQAQSGLSVLDSSAEAGFPSYLRFDLSTESDTTITDIRLHYRTERESIAQVTCEVYIQFVPDTAVDVQWTLDMRKTGGLPPGASLEYWWTVIDASGSRVETSPSSLIFDDNRYDWQSLTQGNVNLYWYEGGQSFAGELMSAAQEALSRLAEDTGSYLKRPVNIYIYANSDDLQGAMIFPQEWTGGVAFTEYGTIAIGINPVQLDWGKRTMAHELTHLVIRQMTFNPYIDLPTWLNEGLAMYNEGTLTAGFVSSLITAIAENSLISVRSLASPFSTDADEAGLSYAQSYSFVEFLVTGYGQEKMLDLLTIFSLGCGYDQALREVYGFDMDGLNALWRDYVTVRYTEARSGRVSPSPALALVGR